MAIIIKTIEEIEQEYDIELERIVANIKKQKAKRVLLQFPDGMKPYSTTIAKDPVPPPNISEKNS